MVHHDRLLPVVVNDDEPSAEISDNACAPQDPETLSVVSSDMSSSSESDFKVDDDDSVDSEPEMIDVPLRRHFRGEIDKQDIFLELFLGTLSLINKRYF